MPETNCFHFWEVVLMCWRQQWRTKVVLGKVPQSICYLAFYWCFSASIFCTPSIFIGLFSSIVRYCSDLREPLEEITSLLLQFEEKRGMLFVILVVRCTFYVKFKKNTTNWRLLNLTVHGLIVCFLLRILAEIALINACSIPVPCVRPPLTDGSAQAKFRPRPHGSAGRKSSITLGPVVQSTIRLILDYIWSCFYLCLKMEFFCTQVNHRDTFPSKWVG